MRDKPWAQEAELILKEVISGRSKYLIEHRQHYMPAE